MTIFNVGGGGGSSGLTFKEMVAGPYEVKISDWPDNITQIPTRQFYYDKNITSVEIKNGITKILANAFESAENLRNVSLPASLFQIDANAFAYTSIENIDLSHVTNLGSSSIYYCTSLQSVTLGNITRINNSTFYYSINLPSITVPASVTRIDANAFYSMGSNTGSGVTITMLPITPPTLASTGFNSVTFNKIIVPQGTLTAYQTATNWAALDSYMEEAA